MAAGAMDNTNGNGDQRVTLAVIASKIDNIASDIRDIKNCSNDHEKRLGSLETGAATRIAMIADLRKDVDNLEKKSDGWSIINSLGVAVAGVLAFLGLK